MSAVFYTCTVRHGAGWYGVQIIDEKFATVLDPDVHGRPTTLGVGSAPILEIGTCLPGLDSVISGGVSTSHPYWNSCSTLETFNILLAKCALENSRKIISSKKLSK